MENPILNIDIPPVNSCEDYFQSSNSLFHFMRESNFLYDALSKKALIPRYCVEDMSFLNIMLGDSKFDEIAILQKCFCDIPLHNITSKIQIDDETENTWSYDHTKVYGEFAIAFSKAWGETNRLQPIQYINSMSSYAKILSDYINYALNSENLFFGIADEILSHLSLIKPLHGNMRRIQGDTAVTKTKNFHDEQEWRYVPSIIDVRNINDSQSYKIEPIIANPQKIRAPFGNKRFIDLQSKIFSEATYEKLWIKFDYNDIRYLIVPTIQDRIDCISFIFNIPDEKFSPDVDSQLQKLVLISKILVLDEIRKDW